MTDSNGMLKKCSGFRVFINCSVWKKNSAAKKMWMYCQCIILHAWCIVCFFLCYCIAVCVVKFKFWMLASGTVAHNAEELALNFLNFNFGINSPSAPKFRVINPEESVPFRAGRSILNGGMLQCACILQLESLPKLEIYNVGVLKSECSRARMRKIAKCIQNLIPGNVWFIGCGLESF